MKFRGAGTLQSGFVTLARAGILLGVLTFALFSPAPGVAHAESPHRAGLVIRYGDGSVVTSCVEFDEAEISGLDLLSRSGLNPIIEQSGGLGGAVCKIGGEGCDFPLDSCFCQCESLACTYWAYYHRLPDGSWEYSNMGAGGSTVQDGDLEAWSWGPGSYGTSGTMPPAYSFDQVCAPPASPTAPPSPTPTNSPVPTATPTSTPLPTMTPTHSATPPLGTATHTPVPTQTATPPLGTATATATPGAATVEFWVERGEISLGQCVNLGWRVSGATAVYLQDQGVVGEEVRQVCPTTDQTYTLRVVSAGGQTERQVFVRVSPVTPAPTIAWTPTLVAAPTTVATQPQPKATASVPLSPTSPSPSAQPPLKRAVVTVAVPLPEASPSVPSETPAALAERTMPTAAIGEDTATPTAQPPSPGGTAVALAAKAVAPANTPTVWALSESGRGARKSSIPRPGQKESAHAASAAQPAAAPASMYQAPAAQELLFQYSLFFLMAALLMGMTLWVIRRQSV